MAAARSAEPEWMDTETVSFEDFRACLRDLETVNRLSLGYRPTLAFLDRLRHQRRIPQGRPLTILDVGSGYGDTLRRIAAWADQHGIAVRLVGVDMNPLCTRSAAEASRTGPPRPSNGSRPTSSSMPPRLRIRPT